MDRYVNVPLSEKDAHSLKAGDYVYLTGTIYTARDAAHKRMQETLDRGEELPLKMENNVIYYMGPSPAREGRQIGSAGPTTASRMDKYAPRLLDLGLKGISPFAILQKNKRIKHSLMIREKNKTIFFGNIFQPIAFYFYSSGPIGCLSYFFNKCIVFFQIEVLPGSQPPDTHQIIRYFIKKSYYH
jgi:fumarate hydratase subunit beta